MLHTCVRYLDPVNTPFLHVAFSVYGYCLSTSNGHFSHVIAPMPFTAIFIFCTTRQSFPSLDLQGLQAALPGLAWHSLGGPDWPQIHIRLPLASPGWE